MPPKRFVTGHSADGKSQFILRDVVPRTITFSAGGTRVTDLWETTETPAANFGNAETVDRPFRLPPPAGGSVFRIVEYPPDAGRTAELQAQPTHDDAGEGYTREYAHARHPGFHKTDTIDYAIVLSGEIYALMDEGEELLRAGDVLVQRGTNHAWSNLTNETVRVAFVLIDAIPAP
jgi:quercetin dioxygenase-like cupin family protein